MGRGGVGGSASLTISYPHSTFRPMGAIFEIHRRCTDCESTRAALRGVNTEVEKLQRDVANFRLDYENLYDKVRVNLSKVAKHNRERDRRDAEEQSTPPVDQMAQHRAELAQRKMGGR